MDQDPRSTCDWQRIVRLVSIAVLVFLALSVGPPWLLTQVRGPLVKRIILRLLLAAQSTYGVLMVAIPVAVGALAISLWRMRRRAVRRPWLVRGFVLSVALMFGLAMAESIAAVWLARPQISTPRLPTRFPDPPAKIVNGNEENARVQKPLPLRFSDTSVDDAVDIVVLGGSSACGAPYDDWLSIGQILAWKLQESIPNRRFRVENLARRGISLDTAHNLMSGLERRPDLVILYAGHNEFDVRYNYERTPLHYADQAPPVKLERSAGEHSPLCRLIQRGINNFRISLPPPEHVSRPLVDVPVYTAAEYAERLHDFRARLEAMAAYCEGLGALVVLVPPPANDANFEPNRSFLLPQTTRAERAQFAREFEAARQTEQTDPAQGIAAYRALLARQPGFAEAHYRLARLLEATGEWGDANRHYPTARDCDGFPVRCTSDFLNAYHEVAARHPRAILLDAAEVFRELSPHGTVADEFFADAHHPSLIGYAALSQTILQELCARRAFDWPASAPAPVVVPADCATHFGMNAEKWVSVCRQVAMFYLLCARIRFDPSQRMARAESYQEAIGQLDKGISPEMLHLPGIGSGGLPAHVHTDAKGNSL
jgi:hypothetical protein